MRKIDVGAEKINNSSLETIGIVIATVWFFDNLSYLQFFQESFLLA